jgi:dephospho-CoA kinase
LKEAALFFESGGNKDMDFMIGVFAPEQLRIERAMKRSQLSESQVRAIMSKQMDEAEKMNHCNFVITNDDITAVLPQVLALHDNLLSYAIGK